MLLLITVMALTERQRKLILERDEHTSQMRHYSEETGFKPKKCKRCKISGTCPLQVHHIETQRNGGMDHPYNLITIYECEHNGKRRDGTLADPTKEFIVHPDMPEVVENYRKGDKKAYQKMQQKRNEQIESGVIYWNSDHDEEMKATARERTDNAIIRGWKWVTKKKK